MTNEHQDEHPVIFENPNTIYVSDRDYTLEDYIRDNAHPDKMDCIKDTEPERVWRITNLVSIGIENYDAVSYIIEYPHLQESFFENQCKRSLSGYRQLTHD